MDVSGSLQAIEYGALAAAVGVAVGNKIVVDFLAEQVLRVINPQLFRARQWIKSSDFWAAIDQSIDTLGLRGSVGLNMIEELGPSDFERIIRAVDTAYSPVAHDEFLRASNDKKMD